MPTYQYACTSCGERLEVVQSFSDDPLTVCPACEGALRKVFSPVGVVFKGSGFYKTDSRRSSGSSHSSEGSSDAATKPSAGKDAGSGDSTSGGTSNSPTAPAAAPATGSGSGGSSTSGPSGSGSGDRVA
jgi:putative FmdB family regulatory protein